MGGGKGGSSSTKIDPAAYAAQNKLSAISEKAYSEGQDVRTLLMDQAKNVLSGNYDPSTLPTYQPLYALGQSNIENAFRTGKESLEGQYGLGRSNILSQTPTGGQLYSALADLERNRAAGASDLSYQKGTNLSNLSNSLAAGLVSDIINRGATGAYSSMGSGISGFGSSANLASQLAQAQLSANTQRSGQTTGMLGSLGQGLGTMIGLGTMGTKGAGTAAAPIGAALGTSAFEAAPAGYFSSLLM
jgi:hypothetical protein